MSVPEDPSPSGAGRPVGDARQPAGERGPSTVWRRVTVGLRERGRRELSPRACLVAAGLCVAAAVVVLREFLTTDDDDVMSATVLFTFLLWAGVLVSAAVAGRRRGPGVLRAAGSGTAEEPPAAAPSGLEWPAQDVGAAPATEARRR